jgi:hypothetical protein
MHVMPTRVYARGFDWLGMQNVPKLVPHGTVTEET